MATNTIWILQVLEETSREVMGVTVVSNIYNCWRFKGSPATSVVSFSAIQRTATMEDSR